MTTQVAAKLPEDLVRQVDELVAAGAFPNRSAAIRQSLESLVSGLGRSTIDESIRQGYTRLPESEEELARAHQLAQQTIEAEPWERWW
ncbi:MAG TPA: ribbon-helix-helix domain-containing protein [Acidimicrobiales bacterium]|nr:ribbon-helix-helix domain-containing protein [Acidimicrobiales bacterium]